MDLVLEPASGRLCAAFRRSWIAACRNAAGSAMQECRFNGFSKRRGDLLECIDYKSVVPPSLADRTPEFLVVSRSGSQTLSLATINTRSLTSPRGFQPHNCAPVYAFRVSPFFPVSPSTVQASASLTLLAAISPPLRFNSRYWLTRERICCVDPDTFETFRVYS
jgi:hypothetical protein